MGRNGPATDLVGANDPAWLVSGHGRAAAETAPPPRTTRVGRWGQVRKGGAGDGPGGAALRDAAATYWSALASTASIAAATSAAPATPRGSLPFGQYSSLWTWSSG